MFEENMHHFIEEFERRREFLVTSVGDVFIEILNGIRSSPFPDHGNPPYLVCDGEVPYLWVGEDGRYKRLPPTFSIPSNITEVTEKTVIYTMPLENFGLIRFIPADPSYQPEDFEDGSSPFDGYGPEFLAGLEQYANILAQQIPSLAAISMARSLLNSYPLMRSKADAENIGIKEFLGLKEVRDFYVSLLGESLVEGAKRAAEIANKARAEKE